MLYVMHERDLLRLCYLMNKNYINSCIDSFMLYKGDMISDYYQWSSFHSSHIGANDSEFTVLPWCHVFCCTWL